MKSAPGPGSDHRESCHPRLVVETRGASGEPASTTSEGAVEDVTSSPGLGSVSSTEFETRTIGDWWSRSDKQGNSPVVRVAKDTQEKTVVTRT